MQRIVRVLAIAFVSLFTASAHEAGAQASLAELFAQGYRLVERSAAPSAFVLGRGTSRYLYDTRTQRLLELFELPELKTRHRLLGDLPGSAPAGALPHRSAPAVSGSMSEIEDLARAAALRRTPAMEPHAARLESELRDLALATNASLYRRFATTIQVEAQTPEELFEILERVSRQRRAGTTGNALAKCSWSACLSGDSLSVSGSCGAETIEISSRGALELSLVADGPGASIVLSREGLTVRQAQGPVMREVTLELDP